MYTVGQVSVPSQFSPHQEFPVCHHRKVSIFLFRARHLAKRTDWKQNQESGQPCWVQSTSLDLWWLYLLTRLVKKSVFSRFHQFSILLDPELRSIIQSSSGHKQQ